MAFPYRPLKDIRIDVPSGKETVVDRQEEKFTVSPAQAGDLEELLWDAYQRVDLEKSAEGQAALCMLKHVDYLELPELSVSAEVAKNQLLRMIGRLMTGYRKAQLNSEETESGEDGETIVSASASKTTIGNEQDRSGKEDKNPNAYVLSRKRWETLPSEDRYQCAFDSIRLLVLLPGSQDDPIRCRMETVYIRHREEGLSVLDNNPLGEDPIYEALSYFWGDQSHKKEIKINDHEVEIGANLESALRNLRRPSQNRKLWVDALCINQSDDTEKSIQVSRMSQIYEQAACVLVWIGPASPDSDLALRTLNSLGTVNGEMFVDDMYDGQHMAKKLWIRPKDPSKLRNASTISNVERTALKNFCQLRRWWTRRWIIQEIAYANRAYLVCGSLALDWDVLSNMFRLNDTIGDAFRGCLWLQNPFILDQQRQETQAPALLLGLRRQGTTLRSLVSRYEGFQCSDPRDWIYCLLGLSSFPPGRIAAAYSKSPREVFIEAAKVMIYDYDNELGMRYPSLNIVCCAYRDRPSGFDLPSWVADWSVRCKYWLFDISENNEQRYDCSREESFLNDLSFPDGDTLQCKALILDRITFVSQHVYHSQPIPTTDATGESRRVSDLIAQKAILRQWMVALKQHLHHSQSEQEQKDFFRSANSICKLSKEALLPSDRRSLSLYEIILLYLVVTATADEEAARGTTAFVTDNSDIENASTLVETLLDESPSAILPAGFTLGITQGGFFGFVPEPTRDRTAAPAPVGPSLSDEEHEGEVDGDFVAILYGANVPVILRRFIPTLSAFNAATATAVSLKPVIPDSYKIIGPACIHGIMKGEALDLADQLGTKSELIRLV